MQELLKLSSERGHRLERQLCVVSGTKLVKDLAEHFVFEDVRPETVGELQSRSK